MNNVIHPLEEAEYQPTIFLAGPISGTKEWQNSAIEIISKDSDLLIATPRSLIWPDPHFDFEKQTDWETKYLWQASETGAILFWLAKQIELSPIDEATGFNRIYSQTTRFELGEWKTRTQLDKNIKMVVGIEKGFADGDYVRQRFVQDCPHIPVTDNLEETCQIAVELVSG